MEKGLFDKKIKAIAKKQKLKRFIFQVLIGIVLFLALIMIGISAFSLVVARGNQDLEGKVSQTKVKIDELREVESKQVYLTSKLASFKDLIVTHEQHQAVVETVFALVPNGTTLKGFDVAEDGVISLSGSVPDFVVLNELLAKIKSPGDYRLPIQKAVVNKVVFGQIGGAVNFEILLTIGV